MTKNILLCFTLIVPLLAVSACSQQAIPNSNAANTSNNTQNANAATGADGFTNAPIVAPPSYNNRPTRPGESPQQQTLPNGLPALKPLKGVNVDKLFSENISNPDRRFERLENAVKDMRREFEAVKPAIVRLVAVEDDIQLIVEQLETIASQEQAPHRSAPTAAPQNLSPIDLHSPQAAPVEPKPQPATASIPTSNASGPTVKNLRTGTHSNKIRLVLDMSAKTPYTVDLDSSENILVIELPQAGWSGASSKTFSAKEPLLASYSVESINGGKGSRIIIPLKKSSAILKQALLPPGVTPNYRMYIDLSI